MYSFSGKWLFSHWLMLAVISSGLSACTKTPSSILGLPEAHSQAEMAPLESRTSPSHAAAKPVTTAQTPQTEVRDLLNAWRDAWSNRDVPRYLSFYQPSFKGNASSPGNWRASRQRMLSQAKKITVSFDEPEIRINAADHATATFNQEYRANNKSDAGRKTLQLRRTDGRWLIEKEVFSASSK